MALLKALVIGATGLIGKQVTAQLLENEHYEQVFLLVRKPVIWQHAKLVVRVVDFSLPNWVDNIPPADAVFCCIGTTMQQVGGNKTLYEQIDLGIPLAVAARSKQLAYSQFLLVSSIGANASARNFYLQLKGRLENVLIDCHFESLHIFRPSFLIGDRGSFRPGEKIATAIFKWLSVFFVGALNKYKPIQDRVVARSMLANSLQSQKGVHYHYYQQMTNIT